MTRFRTPTCGAARPMPGAWYMVSSMSSISLRTLASTCFTGCGDLLQARIGRDQDGQQGHEYLLRRFT